MSRVGENEVTAAIFFFINQVLRNSFSKVVIFGCRFLLLLLPKLEMFKVINVHSKSGHDTL